MTDPNLARLTGLPGALRAEGYLTSREYRWYRDQAIIGGFPAQQVNGVWHFDHHRLAEIAEALGLTAARQSDVA